jgi:hypothetical protein
LYTPKKTIEHSKKMAQISEDVQTVISCQVLEAEKAYVDELVTTTVVADEVVTNLLTLVDPNNSNNTGTLQEVGTTLEITSPTVQITGNAVVTGTMTVQTGTYTGTILINTAAPAVTHQFVFDHGLLKCYSTAGSCPP